MKNFHGKFGISSPDHTDPLNTSCVKTNENITKYNEKALIEAAATVWLNTAPLSS